MITKYRNISLLPNFRTTASCIVSAALATLLLSACTHIATTDIVPAESTESWHQEAPAQSIRLGEPQTNEVVVVINNHGPLGNHAGVFAGSRLSDPAGSYVHARRAMRGWKPGLRDYVRFQTSDGMQIRIYRFALTPKDFAIVLAHLPKADAALPLFCAVAVQNAIAGIGPFKPIAEVGWTTPAGLATLLDNLTQTPATTGVCELADRSPC